MFDCLRRVSKCKARPQIAGRTVPVMGTLSGVICPYGIVLFCDSFSSITGSGTHHSRTYPDPRKGHGVSNFRCLGEQGGVFVVAQFIGTKQTTEVTNGRLKHAECQPVVAQRSRMTS
jgi:hypothetical protein